MSDELDRAAALLRGLFASLDELCECRGNKAKLEVMSIICDQYLDLQDSVKENNFAVAVGVDFTDENIVAHA